jgi:hypothetical protein
MLENSKFGLAGKRKKASVRVDKSSLKKMVIKVWTMFCSFATLMIIFFVSR